MVQYKGKNRYIQRENPMEIKIYRRFKDLIDFAERITDLNQYINDWQDYQDKELNFSHEIMCAFGR